MQNQEYSDYEKGYEYFVLTSNNIFYDIKSLDIIRKLISM